MLVGLVATAPQSANAQHSYTKGKFTVGVLERLFLRSEETRERGGQYYYR